MQRRKILLADIIKFIEKTEKNGKIGTKGGNILLRETINNIVDFDKNSYK